MWYSQLGGLFVLPSHLRIERETLDARRAAMDKNRRRKRIADADDALAHAARKAIKIAADRQATKKRAPPERAQGREGKRARAVDGKRKVISELEPD